MITSKWIIVIKKLCNFSVLRTTDGKDYLITATCFYCSSFEKITQWFLFISLSLYKLSIKNKTKQITQQLNYSTNFKPKLTRVGGLVQPGLFAREKVNLPARVTLSRCKQALMDNFQTTLLHYCEGNYGQN